jgi:hypothetical protein
LDIPIINSSKKKKRLLSDSDFSDGAGDRDDDYVDLREKRKCLEKTSKSSKKNSSKSLSSSKSEKKERSKSVEKQYKHDKAKERSRDDRHSEKKKKPHSTPVTPIKGNLLLQKDSHQNSPLTFKLAQVS